MNGVRSYAGAHSPLPLQKARMLRWVLTIFIALVVFSMLLPWLEKLGVGRLPGDVRFTLFGKKFFLRLTHSATH